MFNTYDFDVTLSPETLNNADEAVEMFEEIVGDVSNVDFPYDFDYEFSGQNEEGCWAFTVYVDAECFEEAYELMRVKLNTYKYEGITITIDW